MAIQIRKLRCREERGLSRASTALGGPISTPWRRTAGQIHLDPALVLAGETGDLSTTQFPHQGNRAAVFWLARGVASGHTDSKCHPLCVWSTTRALPPPLYTTKA